MRRAIWVGALLSAGCAMGWGGGWSDDDDDDDDYGGGYQPADPWVDWSFDDTEGEEELPGAIPGACAPDEAVRGEVERLYETCDGSIHELVTCGGLQTQLARSFVIALVSSNADLLVPEALATFGAEGFSRRPDGSYLMPVGEQSRFSLRFYESGHTEPILEDVFQLDSYLAGIRVDASMSFDEMQDDWDLPCRFAFSFEGPGPLARLLNDGQPMHGSFVMDLSLSDVMGILWGQTDADLGPFASLLSSLELESELEYVDERGDVVIEYSATGTRASLGGTNESGRLRFEVPAVRATSGNLSMQAGASSIEYLALGTLAGAIDYTVAGPNGVAIRVRSDFGDGQAYPETIWTCP